MKFPFALCLALFLTAVADGVNTIEQEFRCPIDGTSWQQRVETSANPRGLRLDLRQLGDVVDPPTMPQCPKCHFPLFNEKLPDSVIERVRPFVMTPDFQLLARKNVPYFSLAQVQEFLRAPQRYIALSYLRAAWQAEERDAVCRRHLEKAREHFAAALSTMPKSDRHFPDTALLCGEVARRLGRWDEAKQRFEDIGKSGILKGTPQAGIVDFQLELIRKRDSLPRVFELGAIELSEPLRAGSAAGSGALELAPRSETRRLGL